jgi:flagellar basal body-associated protein FliL
MAALLKILIIIVGVYLLIKWTFRGFLMYLLGNSIKNADKKMRQQQADYVQQKRKQEGKVTVNYDPATDKKFPKEEGDYIDFEEVR